MCLWLVYSVKKSILREIQLDSIYMDACHRKQSWIYVRILEFCFNTKGGGHNNFVCAPKCMLSEGLKKVPAFTVMS